MGLTFYPGPETLPATDLFTAGGETTCPRLLATSLTVANTSGTMKLSYFTARRSGTIANVRVYGGSTAAAATPTVVRFGLFTVAANGDITLVASTANDTTIFATLNTAYPKALSAAYAKVAGQRYAFASLVVSGAAMPTFMGLKIGDAVINNGAAAAAIEPRLVGAVTAQSDLPESVVAASITNSGGFQYAELLP